MRERDAWRAGLLSLALALAVRLGPAAVRGLERRSFPEQADAFLLYLQTGLRQASTAPLPLYYAPESSGPETVREAAPVLLSRRETPEKPVFTAEDGAAVLLDNDAGVSPDVEDLIQLAPDFPAADGPKVLIYSTHTTESYTKSGENYIETAAYRTLDSGFNMLSLGRALEEALARRGIGVIRDEGLHDYPSYNSAYVSSRKSAEAYLEEFPSLALVLDLVVITRVIPNRPRLLPIFIKPAIASAIMGGAAWAVYGLLSRVLTAEQVNEAGQTIRVVSRMGNALGIFLAIAVAGVVYLVLVVAIRAISKDDLALMPKGDKLARLLRL